VIGARGTVMVPRVRFFGSLECQPPVWRHSRRQRTGQTIAELFPGWLTPIRILCR